MLVLAAEDGMRDPPPPSLWRNSVQEIVYHRTYVR